MSAVWSASRAAVRRRRIQTTVIGLVVLCSTATILLALALLSAASGPFERAFDRERGAHVVAAFDRNKVSDGQLAHTAERPGVEAAAGPYPQAVVDVPAQWRWIPSGSLTVVGRSDPDDTVDRVRLLEGRWATGPGEIVVNWHGRSSPGPIKPGTKFTVRGAPPLTVVGYASSMSKSAGAWVAREQMAALHPTSVQMLYRFTESSTDREIRDSLAEATTGLPKGSLTTTQSYLTLKRAFSAGADSYLPFLTAFGVLGLLVSILIVGNVVSGAVVSGYRHIGVLKALGFTPNQVLAIYLVMISIPTVVGCAVGTLAGDALSRPILRDAFSGIEMGNASIGVGPWVYAVCLLGVPALVLLAALVPALRAHRLSAARAISAGNAPRNGRGLRIQRALGGTRLPRAVSLGLSQPFARPGRTVMMMAAIVLGVTTVSLTTGLTNTMNEFGRHGQNNGSAWVNVEAGRPGLGQKAPKMTDRQIEARLRSLPGADLVTARAISKVRLAGYTQTAAANFHRGDTRMYDSEVVKGHWPHGPGEAAAAPTFLHQHGLAVGDEITLYLNGRQARVTVVGELIEGHADAVESTWETLAQLAPDLPAVLYTVELSDGADAEAYARAVTASDPGLYLEPGATPNTTATTVIGVSAAFTVLLTVVAALGVFNTVLLNTRERRRDLGMLKSIGMTPRQVVVMTVTSVAGPGAVGGLLGVPLGIVAHRLLVDHVGQVAFPESMKDVWHAPQLALLVLAGVAIAVLGALVPARSAARLTIAKVLHNE
ncbi:ABC transporter permease [Streptomyces mobaraensis]|uniref:ABC transporter permease n=1 Tax=Streptomyces mobaraensis TaxID=35621 RepID=UPI00333127A8